MYGPETVRPKLSVPALRKRKAKGPKIAALTAYDYGFARVVDAAGVDLVLVGDSLGMVVQGRASTLPVTVADIAYHCAAVAPAIRSALLVADLPFLSFATIDRALAAAAELMGRGGAEMVKLEGAGYVLEVMAALAERDVPVCAHLGLTPQSVHKLGGFRVQGRDDAAAAALEQSARDVQEAGAQMLVLEMVPSALARTITQSVSIPVIGIGAGTGCDGQILVSYDLLGLTAGKRPRFVRDFLAGRGSAAEAVRAYAAAVRDGSFPAPEEGW
jgi:3-methyl-2-oxobutanoate hydroxymethyltransferase